MATLQQMIYNIRNSFSGGRSSRARGASDRQIEFWIRSARMFLIYGDVRKNPQSQVNIGFEQDLGCVTLSTVDQADCEKYKWDHRVKKLVIPKVLDLPNNAGLTFFGLIDKKTRIYLSDKQYGDLDDYNLYQPSNKRKAMMVGNTIYIDGKNIEKLCTVNVRGIFEDPTLVTTCGSTGDAVCFDRDNDCYPVPPHLEEPLYKYISDVYIIRPASVPQDLTADEVKQTVV